MSLNGDQPPWHELLMRLEGDDAELIPPGAFLYIAERFGLAEQIDRWVIHRAIELLADAQRAGTETSG